MVCVRQESLNVASGHVLTSITRRPAWPNHDFFFYHQKKSFEIAISCCNKVCVGNSTLTFIAAVLSVELTLAKMTFHDVPFANVHKN